jgi:hypothetical protein
VPPARAAVLAGSVFNSGIMGYGVPLAATSLRFTMRHPAVTAAVVGAPHAGRNNRLDFDHDRGLPWTVRR